MHIDKSRGHNNLITPDALAAYISELLSILAMKVQEAVVGKEVHDRLNILRDVYKRNKNIFSEEQIQMVNAPGFPK